MNGLIRPDPDAAEAGRFAGHDMMSPSRLNGPAQGLSPGDWIDGSDVALDHAGPIGRDFTPFDSAWLDRPIIDVFADTVRRHPLLTAIDDGTTRLTYTSVWNVAQHLGRQIAQDTAPGDLVGIMLPTSTAFPIAMLACMAAGRAFLPMDLHYPATWIEQVVEDSALTVVIGRLDDHRLNEVLPANVRRIDIAPSLDAATAVSVPMPPVALGLGPDEPAMVLYTSGSSGRPKGIVNSQRNLLRRVEQYVNAAHISPDDRFLPLSSECTIAGVRERLTALLTGAELHLVDVQRSSARQIATALRHNAISIIYGVPALLRSLAQLADMRAPSSLRVVRVGGDAVLGSDIDQLRAWLADTCLIELGYSSTEAPVMQWFVPPIFPTDQAKMPIGYALAGNQLAILDDDGHPVLDGEVGELVVRSPYVALGRMIDGRCVGDDFPPDPTVPGARLYHTGDLVRLRGDGLFDLIGRKDRQIKIRGQRVEPGEVEAAILRWPGVRDTAVLGRQNGDTTSLVAYVAVTEAAPETLLAELRAHLRQRLQPQLRPHWMYLVAEIPRLPSAKLDIKALRELDQESQRAAEVWRGVADPGLDDAPADAAERSIEQTVLAIWRKILNRQDVGLDADFFDYGGDSLLVIQMMFEIEKALGVELPITIIYQTPTVSSLAAAIRARTEAFFSPLVLIRDGTHASPFFIIHGLGGNVMELFWLGRNMLYPGPVYAIQSRGLDGRQAPNQSVADMASDYWNAIRALQPNGPYHLGGYSFGGLIAFEMACQAQAGGVKVEMLALLDTVTNSRRWPRHVWARWMVQRLMVHMRTILKLPSREWRPHLTRTAWSLWGNLRWRVGIGAPSESVLAASGIPPALEAVRNSNIGASSAYMPGFFDGRLTLVASEMGGPTLCDPIDIWKSHARELDLHRASGSHATMVGGSNGQRVADILDRALDATRRREGAPAVRLVPGDQEPVHTYFGLGTADGTASQ